jgi:hypothetical protein
MKILLPPPLSLQYFHASCHLRLDLSNDLFLEVLRIKYRVKLPISVTHFVVRQTNLPQNQ